MSASALPATPVASAVPIPSIPSFSSGIVDNITLHGNAASGWGFTNNTTSPGPHLLVGMGDEVRLTLVSADGVTHNWFLDYGNDTQPVAGDPSSPDFGTTGPIVWTFNATRAGTYWYRCRYHFDKMVGQITITPPTHYSLYGDFVKGWGFTSSNITKPGPTLFVEAGVNVTLTLYSADGTFHTWFLDLDNSTSVNGGEPQSDQFGGAGNPNPLNYTFKASGGTFVYRCGIHALSMWGMIVVIGVPGPAPAKFPLGLIPSIMVAVIVGVLLLAGMYQVRAVRAMRLKK